MTLVEIKKLFVFVLLLAVNFSGRGEESLNDEALFDLARKQLAKREIEEALSSLRMIYRSDRSNSNINFLMGAAYTELGGKADRAIYHLKKALQDIDENYRVGDFNEKSAPVHTYYYLTVVLADLNECAKAAASLEKLKQYNSLIDLYFVDEAKRHMQKCPFETVDADFDAWLNQIELPANYSSAGMLTDSIFDKEVSIEKTERTLANLDSLRKRELGVVTKELDYSTSAPLYGVQIGSNRNPSPISSYSDIKNVDVFLDTLGVIRYVVGHFSYKQQAEKLKAKLVEKGFPDAFVVNVNNESKYSNQLVSYGNVNLKAGIIGEVDYYVQLGAFKDTIPDYLMQVYLKVDPVQELKYQDMILVALGPYSEYQNALQKREEIQGSGIAELAEAFLVAFNNGSKVSLQEAIDHTERSKKELEKPKE